MPAPHKIVLKELLDRFAADMGRLEAALERLEAVAPHSAGPPADPAAVEAADRMIAARKHELMGPDAPYE